MKNNREYFKNVRWALELRFHWFLPALVVTSFMAITSVAQAQKGMARNPILFADVPDPSIIRVGETYYMASTTMHMNPGVPIMKSKDLVNWNMIGYAYDTLATSAPLNLDSGKSAYGRGSWAPSLRYRDDTYYVTTFSSTTNKTYIYRTKDIEKGSWTVTSFSPSYHDHTLWFDDDGRVYLIYGVRQLKLVELKGDLTGVKTGTERVIIEDASAPANADIMLGAEGSQLFKVNGKYYLFNITWPRGGMRTVIIHRADQITGPWEGRIGLQDRGVAQGGLIETPNGEWFAYLFRDYGAVGRIPYLAPVSWKDGWPVIGVDGKVPDVLNLPRSKGLIPTIVNSDDFNSYKDTGHLPLVWQWNHNPDLGYVSVSARPGYLRLTTTRVDTSFYSVKNILTQRTMGPECSGSTMLDASNMKDGDFAGLTLFQKRFAQVGVVCSKNGKSVVMISAQSEKPVEIESVPLKQSTVYLKAECNFSELADTAEFFYSLDGKSWKQIGTPFKMSYTLPHFMGYRFGLFNYATREQGGSADFDFFRIVDQRTK